MPDCTCKPDLSGEHDPNCPMNTHTESTQIVAHEEPTEKWICPECGVTERLTALMSNPAHRHGAGGAAGGSGLVWLKRVAA